MQSLLVWSGLGSVLFAFACGFPKPAHVERDASPADTLDAGAGAGDADASNVPCARTTCADDVLKVCGTSGTVESIEQCTLGCFSDRSRCNRLAPSNDLGTALDEAAQHGMVTLPAGSVVDTDSGSVTAAGTLIPVANTMVLQPGGLTIRVVLARSWTLNDVRIRGTLPVAFVANDDIDVRGTIDASAEAGANGPGALVCGSAAGGGGPAGASASRAHFDGYPPLLFESNGLGGGGFGSPGGAGGIRNSGLQVGAAGQPNGAPELVPLRGGCEGGSGNAASRGGAGGGAIQLVAGHSVHIVTGNPSGMGVVHVGGGGGIAGALGRLSDTDTTPVWGPGGGGSGGGILIEAPSIILDEGAALLAGGGGGGGYGACSPGPDGVDATPDSGAAAGGSCPGGIMLAAAGGGGGTTGVGATGQDSTHGSAGGGGGGLGRIRINTADGQYTTGTTSLIRGVTTSGTVGRR